MCFGSLSKQSVLEVCVQNLWFHQLWQVVQVLKGHTIRLLSHLFTQSLGRLIRSWVSCCGVTLIDRPLLGSSSLAHVNYLSLILNFLRWQNVVGDVLAPSA